MRAVVYYGPDDLRVADRPVPVIGPKEVLVKVVRTGICATDLRILHGAHRMYPPGTLRIPGHEVFGELVEVGASVDWLKPGQRVFVAPNMGCGRCRQCITGNNNLCANFQALGITLDGSFAEYMRVPEAAVSQGNIIPIEAEIDPAVAALIEPFACVLRGQEAVKIRPGDYVLVLGAGPIGVMHALLARLSGAGRVVVSEILPERAERIAQLGVDRVVNPSKENLLAIVREETNEGGADVVIVAVPAAEAQEAALELAGIRGRINFFGGLPKDKPFIRFNSNLVHYKELIVTGTTACSTSDCHRAAEIVVSGRIDLSPLISANFPLSQIRQAFQTAEDRKSLKVMLEP